MPQILHEVQARYPDLVIHQIEAAVPEQYQQLADGGLDVGIGRAVLAPPQVASHLFRHDPLGVLVPHGHRFAAMDAVPVTALAAEPLLLAEQARAPEFNHFTVEMCRAAGFPRPCMRAPWKASTPPPAWVARGRCVYCAPSSCIAALPATIWRPLTQPAAHYPWSVLRRAGDDSDHVKAIVDCAKAMSQRLGRLITAEQTAEDTNR